MAKTRLSKRLERKMSEEAIRPRLADCLEKNDLAAPESFQKRKAAFPKWFEDLGKKTIDSAPVSICLIIFAFRAQARARIAAMLQSTGNGTMSDKFVL